MTQDLDETTDPRTSRLGSFGFRPFAFEVPDSSAHYSQRLDVREALGVYVDATAGVDVAARRAFRVLRTIGPATGTAPADLRAGFLAEPAGDAPGPGPAEPRPAPRDPARPSA